MNTRQEEALPFRDLARQRARISRQISLNQLTRLEPLTVDVDGHEADGLLVDMAFSHDPDGLVRVVGEISGALALTCNGCAEALAYELRLGFDCVIVDSDVVAAEVSGESDRSRDVVVAEDLQITVAEIVEDEILLGLPERLCVSEPCPRAPATDFPAAESGEVQDPDSEAAQDAEPNPFSVLARLKSQD